MAAQRLPPTAYWPHEYTTTKMTAVEIHQTGLRRVAEISRDGQATVSWLNRRPVRARLEAP